MDSDSAWEKWGKKDPYFSVITFERYRTNILTAEALEEFFKSGQDHVDYVMGTIRKVFDKEYTPDHSLDFGCGVGRLLLPLAAISKTATGIDISSSMLAEAKKNCEARGIQNVELFLSDDALAQLQGHQYDFIHSFIVFQHIPIQRGMRIFKSLMQHLAPGGFMAVQFTYAKAIYAETHGTPPTSNVLSKVAKAIPRVSNELPSLIKRRIKKFLAQTADDPVVSGQHR